MKLALNCPECMLRNATPSYEFQLVSIREDGLYISRCSEGHKFLTNAQLLKYEVILDCAFLALRDGYPREAIINMAASLERFYEFYIRLVCMKFTIEEAVSLKSWAHIASSSERQHGAFIALHMINSSSIEISVLDNSKPNIPNISKTNTKNWKEFRNNVIHKGYIPTYEEAYLYGKLVFDYLKNFHIFLRENQLDDFNITRLYYLSQKIHNVDNLPITNLVIVSILVMSDNISFNFEDTLKILRISRLHKRFAYATIYQHSIEVSSNLKIKLPIKNI